MLYLGTRHLVRKRRTGQLCTCSICGQVVWPYPLPLSPTMRLIRGYPKSRAMVDRRTRAVRFDPMLWCISCAPPVVVQWWARWEEAAAELLQALPSIATDNEAYHQSEPSRGEASCADVDADAIVYNRAALP